MIALSGSIVIITPISVSGFPTMLLAASTARLTCSQGTVQLTIKTVVQCPCPCVCIMALHFYSRMSTGTLNCQKSILNDYMSISRCSSPPHRPEED